MFTLHPDIRMAEVFAICDRHDCVIITHPDGRHEITPRTSVAMSKPTATPASNVVTLRRAGKPNNSGPDKPSA